jgi:hypothetical protein
MGGCMKRLTLKQYATKNRVSIFNVIKMIQRGELEAVEEESDGKKIVYVILSEEKKDNESGDDIVSSDEEARDEMEKLLKTIDRLNSEISELKETIKRCCKES